MTNLEVRILEMLIRVRQFGLVYQSGFPAGSRGHELFALVDGFIDSIQTLSFTRAQHAWDAKEKTMQKKAAVAALRRMMLAIARTARVMARDTPGLGIKFQVPSEKGVQELLDAARSMLANVEPLKDAFVKRGMGANFNEDFRVRIIVVEEMVSAQAQKSGARISTKVAVTNAARNARLAVRELDAVVRNVYPADEAILAEWESASHLGRVSSRAETEEPTPEPAPVGS